MDAIDLIEDDEKFEARMREYSALPKEERATKYRTAINKKGIVRADLDGEPVSRFMRNNEEDNPTAWGGMMFPSERIFGKDKNNEKRARDKRCVRQN